MYCLTNYPSATAVKKAVKSGESVKVIRSMPGISNDPINGDITIEGPHYPEPHTWWLRARVRDDYIIRIL